MAANSIGDFIKSVFSPMIDRTSVVFRSLFADDDESGTVERVFKDLELARKEWEVDGANIYDQRDEQLKKSLDIFSVLEKLNSDTDENILKRFSLLFQRNGDTVWGDKWDVLKIFKSLFGTSKVWLVNNTEAFSKNLMENGDCDNETGWILDGARYDKDAGFEGAKGLLLDASGNFFQIVKVKQNTSYFLHFFLNGGVNVSVESNGRFWNPKIGEVGGWTNGESYIPFDSADWNCQSFYFITDGDIADVKIKFSYASGKKAYVDYVMLNEKTKASTFSIIALFEGSATDETALYAPGADDPIRAFDYKKMGYFAPGKADVAERNMDALSYYDQSPLSENFKEKKVIPQEYDNKTYLDGENLSVAPDNDKGVDYEKASFIDTDFFSETSPSLTQKGNDPMTGADLDKQAYFSAGEHDKLETVLDQSTVINDNHPVMDSVKEDFARRDESEYENMTYLDDETPVLAPESPIGKENPPDVDYEKMSYYDKSFIFGSGGSAMRKNLYQEILDIVQPAGVSSTIELLTREVDEN